MVKIQTLRNRNEGEPFHLPLCIVKELIVTMLNYMPCLFFPVFISGLCNESKDYAVNQLLAHLPLLRPGNNEAKAEYLNIIPKILQHSIENGIHIEESRQLLSYSLIHPAINSDERSQFTLWLGHLDKLEEQFSYGGYTQTPVSQAHINGQCPQYIDTSVPGNRGSFSGSNGIRSGSRLNEWQTTGQRDSGIVLNGPDGDNLLTLNSLGNVSSNGVLLRTNGALGGDSGHTPLHSTASAPPDFQTGVPCTQSSRGNLNNSSF